VYTYYVTNLALRRPRFFEETVCGLPLLRTELPRRWNGRWVGELQRLFGASGAFNLPKEPKPGCQCRLIATQDLWQSAAVEVALCALAQQGRAPAEATVGVWASHLNRQLYRVLEGLADRVQALALEVPRSEAVALRLQRRNGIPIRQGEGDVTVCFAPAQPGAGRLLLGQPRPEVPQMRLWVPGVPVPEGCPETELYAALLQAGRLPGKVEVLLPRTIFSTAEGQHSIAFLGERC
jgi:hypothetical protein